jgi:hypothetical protein
VADARLVTPPLPTGTQLSFYHTYEFESPDYDGGVIEISTNGGTTYTDLSSRILQGGYTGTVDSGFSNPLAGRTAWVGGTLGPMTKVVVDFSGIPANARVRVRFGADSGVASTAWEIDNVKVSTPTTCLTSADPDWSLMP